LTLLAPPHWLGKFKMPGQHTKGVINLKEFCFAVFIWAKPLVLSFWNKLFMTKGVSAPPVSGF
jgi:hypothetical protein